MEATHHVQAISDKIFNLTFHKQPWRLEGNGMAQSAERETFNQEFYTSKTNTKKKRKKEMKEKLTYSKQKQREFITRRSYL